MSSPAPDNTSAQLDFDDMVQRIAQGTRQIIDAMEASGNNSGSTFEQSTKELAQKSEKEKVENRKRLEEERDRIRERFRSKWQRY